MIWLCKIVASILLANSSYCLLGLHALMKSYYVGKAHMTRNRGWLAANSQQGTNAPSPNFKELGSANNYMTLEVNPSSAEPWDETLALADTLTAAL